MTKIDLSLFRRKFRGSILGVLTGDCLGSPYENEKLSSGSKLVLQKSFDKLEGPPFKGIFEISYILRLNSYFYVFLCKFSSAPVMQFTDDSAMTMSLAESLIEKKELDLVDLAKKFVKSYYQEPQRGYGSGVVTVCTTVVN